MRVHILQSVSRHFFPPQVRPLHFLHAFVHTSQSSLTHQFLSTVLKCNVKTHGAPFWGGVNAAGGGAAAEGKANAAKANKSTLLGPLAADGVIV